MTIYFIATQLAVVQPAGGSIYLTAADAQQQCDWFNEYTPYLWQVFAVEVVNAQAVTRKSRRPCFDEDPAICLDQLDVYRSQVETELIRQRQATGRGGVRVAEDDPVQDA